jgi:hypothetical protein
MTQFKSFELTDDDRATAKTYGISYLVGNINVGESDREVARNILKRCKIAGTIAKSLRKVLAAFAVEEHRKNRDLYNDVVMGRIGGTRVKAKKRG